MPSPSITCPHCSRELKVTTAPRAGSRFRCPACRTTFAAPSRDAPRSQTRLWLLGVGAVVLLLLAGGVGLAVFLAARGGPHADAPTPKDPPPDPDRPRVDLPPVDQAPPPEQSVLPPEQQAKVNAAIDKGVAFLKKTQQADGSWPAPNVAFAQGYQVGVTALVALTLLNCGVPADGPEMQKAAAFVRKGAPSVDTTSTTYELALAVLFLDRLGDGADEPLIQSLAARLIAGQTPSGGWNYRCPKLGAQPECDLLTALRVTRPASPRDLIAVGPVPPSVGADPAKAKTALDALPAALRNVPALQPPTTDDAFPAKQPMSEPGDAGPHGTDNSNTQFAVLGLWTARRHDVPAERALSLVNQRFRLSQRGKGGWGYLFGIEQKGGVGGNPRYGWDATRSMTAAGLLGLAVGHGVTADLSGAGPPAENAQDAAFEKGMKALGEYIGGAGDATPPDLYFLWSVERVGVLYGRKTIGDQEWYPWGAKILVQEQAQDGSWHDGLSPPPVGSSFALLFLKRVNVAGDLSTELQFLTQIKK